MVIGTVQGDIHDIGKDIVALMLGMEGYSVHDLGIDVPVEDFVAAIEEHDADIVGLCGLLTLAFDAMKSTVDGIADAGLRDRVKIMIGGAPVDENVRDVHGGRRLGPRRDSGAADGRRLDRRGGMTLTPQELLRSARHVSTTSSR